MANGNIVRFKTDTGKEVSAVNVGNDIYIDENGIKHIIRDKSQLIRYKSVSADYKALFEQIKEIYLKQDELDARKKELVKEINDEKKRLAKQEKSIIKELRNTYGVIKKAEFVKTFYNALPQVVKSKMKEYGYTVGSDAPRNMCFCKDNIFIVRNVEVYRYNRFVPYCKEEYDGDWRLRENAKSMVEYKQDIRKSEKMLPVNEEIYSYLWTADRCSTWYSGVYEIAVKERMTKEYAIELAKEFAKQNR